MKNHPIILRILFLVVATVSWWGNIFSQTYFNNLEQTDSINIWIGNKHTDSSYSLSGKYSALTDSLFPYGLGVEMRFPKKIQNKNTVFSLNGYVLSDTVYPNALYVIAIENKGEIAFWKGVPLQKIITEKNRWFAFEDSVMIPAYIAKTGTLKVYLWNAGRKNRVFVDDFSVSFKPYHNPTFLKDVNVINDYAGYSKENIIFKNIFYQIRKKEKDGFIITDTAGTHLINYIRYFFDEKSNGERYNDFTLFQFVSKKEKNGETVLRFNTKTPLEKVNLELVCSFNSPVIKIEVIKKFIKRTDVTRSALLIDYALPLKEVFRANRKSDVTNFQDEYWLDKQGFLCGTDSTSLAIYYPTKVSSLQLDTKKQLAVINLDFEKDHPYMQFPLNADSIEYKVDESSSIFSKGDKLTLSFSISAGAKEDHLPRFMKNPNGYLSTYIWTEHADWGDIRTHRATYFGSEKIDNADSAIGGFVKFHIPVTKSVFYDNPDSVKNTRASDSLFTSLESAIRTDTAYEDFLFRISEKGNEICLHTPEQFTTTPVQLEDALSYMKKHFHSPTWIDHGYNNHPENNREDFVCSGIENFAADLWKKYGIRYFWNPYYEDYQTFINWGFFGSIEKFYSGYGDFFPKPDYWKHPSRTGSFYHWPTMSVLYIEHEGLWNYFFSEHQFRVFTDDWGVEMNHCYPAWTLPGKGFWKFASDGTIVAMDGFNRTLQIMATFRERGLLNITTVKQFLNYQLDVERVAYTILPDGRIKLTNNGSQIIKGLSLATKAKAVLVNDMKPNQKHTGDDLIFWFDLKSGESVIIRMVD